MNRKTPELVANARSAVREGQPPSRIRRLGASGISAPQLNVSTAPPVLMSWDEPFVEYLLDRTISGISRQPLRSAPRPEHPATYLIHYEGGSRSFLPYELLRGQVIYIGSLTSQSLGRFREHRSSLEAANNLSLDDFSVSVINTTSRPGAIYLEALLLAREPCPLWNSVLRGFGNKPTGRARRSGQRQTPWDSLHPGRLHVSTSNPHDTSQLLADVTAYIDARQALSPPYSPRE